MRMRKKRHGSERLLALSSLLYPNPSENWVPAAEVFGNDRPLRLEVGCGKGDFIVSLSEKEPDYNYIALERIADVCVVAVEKYARRRGLGDMAPNGGWLGLDGNLYKDGAVWDIPEELRGNVRFLVADANEFIQKMPENSLDSILANFSDPWPGKGRGEVNRRLTSPAFLESYRRVLTPDGKFAFKTDNEELFDYTAEVLPQNGFSITFLTRDLHATGRDNIVTEYERNFTEKGVKIKMLEAVPVK